MTAAMLKHIRSLLDAARTTQQAAQAIDNTVADIIGWDHVDAIVEYTTNRTDMTFEEFCRVTELRSGSSKK